MDTLEDERTELRAAETPDAFAFRVHWLEGQASTVTITALGRAMLRHAEMRRDISPEATSALSVTIDPEDPLAYARIFELLSIHGDGLLIDRYLKLEGLGDLLSMSTATRVLTGDDSRSGRLGRFARVVGPEERMEVRTVPAADLHDRFFIPDSGPVFALGSSLNSIDARPGVVTTISEAPAAAVRGIYESMWAGASPLPAMPADTSTDT